MEDGRYCQQRWPRQDWFKALLGLGLTVGGVACELPLVRLGRRFIERGERRIERISGQQAIDLRCTMQS